jgi:hypothetical protein
VTLSDKAMALAEAQAAKDRDLLARLQAAGEVMRVVAGDEDARAFVADIQRRIVVRNRRRPDPTIIPKSKRRRR